VITPPAPVNRRIGPRSREYENAYFHVDSVTVEFPDHAKTIFVSEHGQRVGIVIADGNSVLLVRQYRLLVDALAWEIPGGKVDADETLEQAAFREAHEETGLRCHDLMPLVYFHPGLDTCNNPTFVFRATKFESDVAGGVSGHEVSDQVWLPLAECLRMVFQGQIVDSLTVSALLAHQATQQCPDLVAQPSPQFGSQIETSPSLARSTVSVSGSAT
jgi:ADP-ribose pyrophosphatase